MSKKLKAISGALLFAGIVTACGGPLFGKPKHAGMSYPELQRYTAESHLWTLKYTNAASFLSGAGVALLFAGYMMQEGQDS